MGTKQIIITQRGSVRVSLGNNEPRQVLEVLPNTASKIEVFISKPSVINTNLYTRELAIINGYVHSQDLESAVWVVNHSFDKYPSVIAVDSSKKEIIGDVRFLDRDTLSITFSQPITGYAYIN